MLLLFFVFVFFVVFFCCCFFVFFFFCFFFFCSIFLFLLFLCFFLLLFFLFCFFFCCCFVFIFCLTIIIISTDTLLALVLHFNSSAYLFTGMKETWKGILTTFNSALEIIIFHYVYCTHQISDTMYTVNLHVYRLSYSHKIYLLQSKTKYMHMLILYICFQTCSCTQSPIVSIEY